MTPREKAGIRLIAIQDAITAAEEGIRILKSAEETAKRDIQEAEEQPAAEEPAQQTLAEAFPKTNQPAEPPARSRKERVLALLDEWLADDSGYDEETWDKLRKAFAYQPAPPAIEVKMRCEGHEAGGWKWQCWLAKVWISGACSYNLWSRAQEAGNNWLAALSQQLGVKLKAEWEAKPDLAEPDIRRCDHCGGLHGPGCPDA